MKPFISIKDVTKVYQTNGTKTTALHGANLSIRPGEFVSIVGKSGSGKSTLINMITGIDRPTTGEVRVGETMVHALNEGQTAVWRGRTIGVIFQFFQLLPTLTALENVMLPMDLCGTVGRRERPSRAMHLLEQLGMADYAHKLPSELSGGEQQRVAIARALANNPPLLVADEPTGNLDTRTAERIAEVFETLVQEGKTIVIVTHDRDLAQCAMRTILLSDGEIVNEYINQPGTLMPEVA